MMKMQSHSTAAVPSSRLVCLSSGSFTLRKDQGRQVIDQLLIWLTIESRCSSKQQQLHVIPMCVLSLWRGRKEGREEMRAGWF